jgi:hypothetical protein
VHTSGERRDYWDETHVWLGTNVVFVTDLEMYNIVYLMKEEKNDKKITSPVLLVPILYMDVSREGDQHILEMDGESWRETERSRRKRERI